MGPSSLPAWLQLEWHELAPVPLPLGPLPATTCTGPLRVVIAADYRTLPAVADTPTLLCRPANAHTLWVGPLFRAGEVPCPRCLQFWLSLREETADEAPPPSANIWQHAARMLCGALTEYASIGDLPELRGAILMVDLKSNRMRRAQFGVGGWCSHPHSQTTVIDPEAHLNPITGIVENLTLAPSAFAGLSFTIGRLACPSRLDRVPAKRRVLSSLAVGANPEEASLKLLMEAAERQSAMYYGTEVLQIRPLTQYALFADAIEKGTGLTMPRIAPVASPNSTPSDIGWVQAQPISGGEPVLLPANRVYLDYAEADGHSFHVADTNGCAAHLSYPDAVCNALLEVIERDAVGIWWHRRAARPLLETAIWPECEDLASALASVSRTMWILNLTHDLGIPVVAALSSNSNGGEIYVGAGAAKTLREAACKAAREMISFWFWDQHTRNVGSRAEWLHNAALKTEPWLRPTNPNAEPQQRDAENPESTDAVALSRLLESAGFVPLHVDLTRPWLGIATCRVIVPGLCDLHGRTAITRLRTLPERLGWKVHSTPESGWNPYECPI